MPSSAATPITCPNCRQPFSAVVEQLIDVSRDPQAKSRLLAGRLNAITCPHCGFQSALSTPLAYHDPDKQLLITYMPMELGLPQKEQERVIGNFTNTVINSLPPEKRKGYLFTPKTALTMQGMIDMILEGDGVTPEVIAAQREKMRLVEAFLQADPSTLPDLVQQHDAEIDMDFFAILAAAAETSMANGRRDVAESILQLREQVVQLSTVGREALSAANTQQEAIQEVANALNGLGTQASRDDLVALILQLAQDGDEKLQVAVGLARPAMDYEFFQALTARLDAATGDDKAFLEEVRSRLVQLVGMVDQQNEAIVRRVTDAINIIMNSPDVDAALENSIDLIDDAFLQVLSYNVQAAEQSKNVAAAARLKTIFEKAVALLQSSAPPAIQFINELMSVSDPEEARAALVQGAATFGPELIAWFDVLLDDLAGRGNSDALERLVALRDEAERILTDGMSMPAASAPEPQPDAAPTAPSGPRLITNSRAPDPAPGAPKIELLPSRNRPRRDR